MSGLSNFLARRNAARDTPLPLTFRPIRPDESIVALNLILTGHSAPQPAIETQAFAQQAAVLRLDLGRIWVAVRVGGEPARSEVIAWAVLPLMLAGKSMVLMVPPRLTPGLTASHVGELIAHVLHDPALAHRVQMTQVLLDPDHRAVGRALIEAGFEEVCELVYLRRVVRPGASRRPADDQHPLVRYAAATHDRFAACIARTYEQSLDCPRLTGRREMNDIIAGHQAAGAFDPDLWMLLTDSAGQDLGVMLLNRLPVQGGSAQESYELTYIGLVPEARGRGLADVLLRIAVRTIADAGGGTLVTACDATNIPARRLYTRHGFANQYVRSALIKDLRAADPTTTPASSDG